MMELFDEENAYTALAEQWENYGTLRSTFGRLQGKNYIEDERRVGTLSQMALQRC